MQKPPVKQVNNWDPGGLGFLSAPSMLQEVEVEGGAGANWSLPGESGLSTAEQEHAVKEGA